LRQSCGYVKCRTHSGSNYAVVRLTLSLSLSLSFSVVTVAANDPAGPEAAWVRLVCVLLHRGRSRLLPSLRYLRPIRRSIAVRLIVTDSQHTSCSAVPAWLVWRCVAGQNAFITPLALLKRSAVSCTPPAVQVCAHAAMRHSLACLPSFPLAQDPPEEGPEQVVILAQILASPVTVGYRAGGWCVRLKRFNGVRTISPIRVTTYCIAHGCDVSSCWLCCR
jgi:hypothetical protein